MPDSPTLEPESATVCFQGRRWSACTGESFYKEDKGWRYCVLHFPGKEKSAGFKEALQRKLDKKDFNFRGVWFPDDPSFSKFEFSAAADFREATFSAGANFDGAIFSGEANFCRATFDAEAKFTDATFSAANFFRAKFC